jgi:hypothetical protein
MSFGRDPKYGDLTWEDVWDPNEHCRECGLEVMNYHYSCQGHQNCLPECPACGGGLQEIDYQPEPEDLIGEEEFDPEDMAYGPGSIAEKFGWI